MKWGDALLSSIFLARRLRNVWAGQEMVGILLPPSVPGALVNFAALLSGKIPVNLNYTASNETLASCAQQCNLQTVITTKLLLEKLPLQVPGKQVLLEEIAARPRLGEKLVALIAVVPARPAARTRSRRRKIAISRRSRHHYFFQRQHRRTQRRDAHSLQHHVQH